MAVYVFVFQNIVIKKRSFYIFTIFRDSQLVFAPLKKTITFRILCFRISDLYCQLTNYSWATILFWLSLPNGSINCFLMKRKISIFWNIVINCCSFLTLRWEWHQALIKKCRNLLLLISFPTQSPLDRMIDQSLLDFLGITPFEERLWSWKCRYIFLHLTHDIFHLCDSWHHFVECFLQRWCCRHKQRFRGYLCDFSLLLIYCHIRNWDCVHNEDSCILDVNMLSNSSQWGFDKVAVIFTWHLCH